MQALLGLPDLLRQHLRDSGVAHGTCIIRFLLSLLLALLPADILTLARLPFGLGSPLITRNIRLDILRWRRAKPSRRNHR